MPFLRSLATLLLSLLFLMTISMAITSYTIGDLIQKNSIKNFFKTEILGTEFINQQCESRCNEYQDYRGECMSLCLTDLTNQTETGVDRAVDEIYKRQFFNMNLEQISYFFANYISFAVIGIFVGIVLLIVSTTPFLTLGKNLITIAISLFISSFIPQFTFASINLPLDLGQTFTDYLSSGFNQQMVFGIIFLIAGIILVVINYVIDRRRMTRGTKIKESTKNKK